MGVAENNNEEISAVCYVNMNKNR